VQAVAEVHDTLFISSTSAGLDSGWEVHLLPFQLSAIDLPTAMQNVEDVQDTLTSPSLPVGATVSVHPSPFQLSASGNVAPLEL
jgi:hypothetical protein